MHARLYGPVVAVTDGFVDAVSASPVGVTFLARLETRAVHPERRGLVAPLFRHYERV